MGSARGRGSPERQQKPPSKHDIEYLLSGSPRGSSPSGAGRSGSPPQASPGRMMQPPPLPTSSPAGSRSDPSRSHGSSASSPHQPGQPHHATPPRPRPLPPPAHPSAYAAGGGPSSAVPGAHPPAAAIPKSRPYTCEICGFAFSQKSDRTKVMLPGALLAAFAAAELTTCKVL